MNKKKLLFIVGIVLLIIGTIILIIAIKDDKKDNKEDNADNPYRHEMLVKINPLVKITFDIDSECKESPEICLNSSSKVVDIKLVNDKAKTVYKDLDLKDKTVYDAILILCDTAKENNIDVKELKITSEYLVNTNDLDYYIKNNSSQQIEPSINYEELDITNISDLENIPTTTTTTRTAVSVKVSKKTTEDPHKDAINLNSGIKVTINEPCGTYIKINSICMNNTIAKIKERFPSAKQKIIDLAKRVDASDSDDISKIYKKYPLSFKEALVSCAQAPAGGSICGSGSYGGVYTTCDQNGLQLHYLTTNNNTYKKNFEHDKIEKYMSENNIYYESRCGGKTPETVTLTEELCEQYNLKCDRW